MIAVDTSALIAILLGESGAAECSRALASERAVAMSAITLTEAIIVSRKREVEGELLDLVSAIRPDIVPVDMETALRVGEVQRRWGKANHPAKLNICDCFAYDVARQLDCPLLFIGDDFSQTDIARVL